VISHLIEGTRNSHFFLESGQIAIAVNRLSRIPVKNDFKGSSKLILESFSSDRLNDFNSFYGRGIE